MRKRRWVVQAPKILVLMTIVIAGFGSAVLYLWNWLMPELFGLHSISFGQALGLLALSWMLFGHFPAFRGRDESRWRRAGERWQRMTPEQREQVRLGLQAGCGPWQPPAEQTKV